MLTYTDSVTALHDAAVWFDRSDRIRLMMAGAKPAETLTGLVTNDVLALTPGTGQYACALTPKGKIIADVRILASATSSPGTVGELLVDTSAAAGPGFLAMIRKYVNPRLASYRDVTAETGCIALAGPRAAQLLSALLRDVQGAALPVAAFAHVTAHLADDAVRVARSPELGDVPVFDLFCSAEATPRVRDALIAAGAQPGDPAAWELARIEAGRPAWGRDMDESTLAQEAEMDAWDAISYDKGCYTGQETVARVHFRGHVNRTIRRVSATAPMAEGSELLDADGKAVGSLRSVATSPDGRHVGLALLRREVAAGAALVTSAGVPVLADTAEATR